MSLSLRVKLLSFLFRRTPRWVRGRWRLARLLMGSALDDTGGTLKTNDGHLIQVPCLREPVAFSILVDGSYEEETWHVIKAHLPNNGVFVDIGANVGLFTLKAAKYLGNSGKVISIEASPKIFPYLQRNITSSGYQNISCLAIASTDHDDVEIPFYDAPDDHFGMGSLAPQFNMPPKFVVGATLDTLLTDLGISHVDVVKVDVEGFEAAVFRGAAQTFTSHNKPIVVFEFLDWAEERAGYTAGAAQSLLLEYGYSLMKIGKAGTLGNALVEPIWVGGTMLVAIPVGITHGHAD
jgi:FkbM family methyltransferase